MTESHGSATIDYRQALVYEQAEIYESIMREKANDAAEDDAVARANADTSENNSSQELEVEVKKDDDDDEAFGNFLRVLRSPNQNNIDTQSSEGNPPSIPPTAGVLPASSGTHPTGEVEIIDGGVPTPAPQIAGDVEEGSMNKKSDAAPFGGLEIHEDGQMAPVRATQTAAAYEKTEEGNTASKAKPLLSTSPMPAARDDDGNNMGTQPAPVSAATPTLNNPRDSEDDPTVRNQPQVVLPIRPPPRSILSFPDDETDREDQPLATVFQAPQQTNDQGSQPPVQGRGEQQLQPPSGSPPNDEEIGHPNSLEATLVQSVEATLLPIPQRNEPRREQSNNPIYVAARVPDEGGCRRYKNYIFTAIAAGLAAAIGVLFATGTFNRDSPSSPATSETTAGTSPVPPEPSPEEPCEPVVIDVLTDQAYRDTWYEIKQNWSRGETVYHSTTIDLQVNGEIFFAADVEGTATDTSVSGKLCYCEDGSERCSCPGQVCLIGKSADMLDREVSNCEDGGGVGAIIFDTIKEFLWSPSGSGNIPAAFIRKVDGEYLLKHSLGKDVLMSDDSQFHFKPKTLNSRSICLPEGEYEFSIHDHAGDGICCGGYYKLTSYGVTIKEGGEFESNESTTFSLPFVPNV